MSSNSSQNIQVTIELGHQASFKKKPSTEGYTHDWSVFVRGPEGSKIQHYVEKVVFQLHESFAKPKRVVKEPPYQVSESGYAGFNFPIIIYFRNKEIPKKISFDYDLFLNAENCPPINNVRYEKLTFKNPNEEFRQKLLKAGGQPMGNPALMETAGTPSSSSKSDSGKKLPKSSTSTTSSKDGSSSNSKDKTPKHKSSLISSNSGGGSSSKPSTPQSTPVASKEIKSVTHTTTISVSKDHKSRGKEAQKRPSTSSPPDEEMSGKKIKRSSSISSDLGKEKHSHKSDKDKKKSSKDSSKSKSKHSSKSDKHEKKKDKHKHSSSSSDKKMKNTLSSSETKTSSNSQSSKKSSDSIPFPSDIAMKTALLSPLKDSSDDDEDDKTVKKDSDSVSSLSSDLSSSSSSISLSPLPEAERKKNNSKYDALMAELGDSDSSDDDFNVKIPVIPPSPPPPPPPPPTLPKSTPETKPVAVIESKQTKKSKSSSSQSKKSSSKSEKSKSKESKKKDSSKSSKESKTPNSKESLEVIQNGVAKEDNKSEVVAENGETLASLWELHDRIMASRDSDMLEEVVGLIQETGLFKVTDTSFDFDLCSIDKETVQKIFKCVSSVS
ncbi:protein AF-9 isoform X2 [Patella vulgata]|uniref:protein AF-9 isoform X2 n=1 Tax=Patella vulgata TaxID=6465 RepID=UPI0021804381|nr:protein AF-9 isoform X2 [Patella vulgata]